MSCLVQLVATASAHPSGMGSRCEFEFSKNIEVKTWERKFMAPAAALTSICLIKVLVIRQGLLSTIKAVNDPNQYIAPSKDVRS